VQTVRVRNLGVLSGRLQVFAATLVTAVLGLGLSPNFVAARPAQSSQLETAGGVRLTGHVQPLIRSAQDLGPIDPSQKISLALVFAPTSSQQAALQQLLQDQQNPTSPRFRQWITPQQFADAYGLSTEMVDAVRNWLGSAGIAVREVAPSRNRISFDATAAQAQQLFSVEIHRYQLNDEVHYANSAEPMVPQSLSGSLVGIRGLNDFKLKPRSVRNRRLIQLPVEPSFTSSISGSNFLTPDDFATIYDVKALYNGGIDGTGQKVAIAGQTDIKLTDIEAFRTAAGLPKNDPQVILDGTDPGTSTDDMTEADLDVEWSGGIAKGATVLYVNSSNVLNSFEYAITNNLAPVLAISYGTCEAGYTSSDVQSLVAMTQQANAQGMTLTASSGDSGAADCEAAKSTTATTGLSVDVPASIPNVTGVGGTRFVEGSNTSQYWSATNNSSNGSALSYIPEEAWNDTAADKMLAASGGGISTLFAKPSWQSGIGVPADGQRDVPDVAFSASADHDGYLYCSNGSCVTGFRDANNNLSVVGGTSAGSPSMAGIVTLLNQKIGSRLGNVNPTLYTIAASSSTAFHDVTTGNNMVPCTTGSKNCTGGSLGYSAGVGYDQVTGLGSVDVFNLATEWENSAPAPDFQLSASPSSVTISGNTSAASTLTVTAISSFSGTVMLTCSAPTTLSCSFAPASFSTSGTSTLTITALNSASVLGSSRSRWGFLFDVTRFSHVQPGLPATGFCLCVLLIFALWRGPRSVRVRASGFASLALLIAGVCIGCGGGSSSNTKGPTVTAGTYTVEVTAQSGTITHTANVQVTVQ
jgi:subtilase family serine protease